MFDDHLFIYTYFDKGKVGVFKDSISKILQKVGINGSLILIFSQMWYIQVWLWLLIVKNL